mmetsp:Transcript_122328/g.346852  ORF Transcript_122328/g.346852 Transcript_122328/m.346852 type:complete len:229 (-) Transcript_122328:181-867(-)
MGLVRVVPQCGTPHPVQVDQGPLVLALGWPHNDSGQEVCGPPDHTDTLAAVLRLVAAGARSDSEELRGQALTVAAPLFHTSGDSFTVVAARHLHGGVPWQQAEPEGGDVGVPRDQPLVRPLPLDGPRRVARQILHAPGAALGRVLEAEARALPDVGQARGGADAPPQVAVLGPALWERPLHLPEPGAQLLQGYHRLLRLRVAATPWGSGAGPGRRGPLREAQVAPELR